MANASLIINCADEFNSTYPQESFEIMSNVSTYIWILYSLCILGVTNNSITLYIFYRLKWFREKKMILFTNLAVIDTLVCLSAIVAFAINSFDISNRKSAIRSQLSCVESMFIFYGFWMASSTFALAIAVDRFVSKWWPYHWGRYETKFRITFVILTY